METGTRVTVPAGKYEIAAFDGKSWGHSATELVLVKDTPGLLLFHIYEGDFAADIYIDAREYPDTEDTPEEGAVLIVPWDKLQEIPDPDKTVLDDMAQKLNTIENAVHTVIHTLPECEEKARLAKVYNLLNDIGLEILAELQEG